MPKLFVEPELTNCERQTSFFEAHLTPVHLIQLNLFPSYLSDPICFEVKSAQATEKVFRRSTLRRPLKSKRSMVNFWTIKVDDAIEQQIKIDAYLPAEIDSVASHRASLELL